MRHIFGFGVLYFYKGGEWQGKKLDIVSARQAGRLLAREIGFDLVNETRITTAISELARNIILYALRFCWICSRLAWKINIFKGTISFERSSGNKQIFKWQVI